MRKTLLIPKTITMELYFYGPVVNSISPSYMYSVVTSSFGGGERGEGGVETMRKPSEP